MPKFRLGEFATRGGKELMECVFVIPANTDPKTAFIALLKEGFQSTTRIEELKSRDHESYIFAGPTSPRGGKRKLYWPRVSSL